MYTDDFYHYLSKGAIPPHLPESNDQNLIVIEAFLEAAKRYARGGYDVIVDGIIGPWFLKPWLKIIQEGYEVHYIKLVEAMWIQFCNLAVYEPNVIDTTNFSIKETVSIVKEKILNRKNLLCG